MSILKTIVTTTVQIVDGDNRPGNGSLTIRPNAPFEYFDGASTIQVSNAAVTIPVVGGKLGATLQLQPNTGASNVPETWYIVDVDINEVPFQLFWQIDSADAATIEFTDVTQLPTSANINQGLVAHVRAANPHGQYGLRSDMVSVGTIGAASDGLGYIPRVDPVTGKLDSSLYSGGTGGITAADVPIVDSGGYYTATEVEAALAEAGSPLSANAAHLASTANPHSVTASQAAALEWYAAGWMSNSGADLTATIKPPCKIGNVTYNTKTQQATNFAADNDAAATSQFILTCPTGTTVDDFALTIYNDITTYMAVGAQDTSTTYRITCKNNSATESGVITLGFRLDKINK